MPHLGILRLSQCPQVQGRGREEELQMSKRGTGEAEQGFMMEQQGKIRCTAELNNMNNRCIAEVQQRHYTELRIHNTAISSQFNIKFTSNLIEQVFAQTKTKYRSDGNLLPERTIVLVSRFSPKISEKQKSNSCLKQRLYTDKMGSSHVEKLQFWFERYPDFRP